MPPGLRKVAKKHKKHDNGQNGQNGNQPGQGGQNPNPFPTYSCDPTVVTCGRPEATGRS